MTNWDIIKLVNIAVNHDANSMAFTADEYKTLINAQSLKLFKVKLDPDGYRLGHDIQQGVGSTKKIDKDLNPFLVSPFADKAIPSGILDLMAENPAYINSIIPYDIMGRGIDMIGPDEIGDRMRNPITAPSLKDPVAYEVGKNKYQIVPGAIARVYVSYYKYPTNADFSITFNEQTLYPIYTAIAELEWSDINKVDIAYFIMRDAGLSIGRGDVAGMAERIINSK